MGHTGSVVFHLSLTGVRLHEATELLLPMEQDVRAEGSAGEQNVSRREKRGAHKALITLQFQKWFQASPGKECY